MVADVQYLLADISLKRKEHGQALEYVQQSLGTYERGTLEDSHVKVVGARVLEAEVLIANRMFQEARARLTMLESSVDRDTHEGEFQDVLSLLETLYTEIGPSRRWRAGIGTRRQRISWRRQRSLPG